ncbi:MAG: hypothetical protein IT229_04955 [Flavobacteriales bacterium]|nr:hypothetical protein [Flavobacteriales bacterium]
MSTSLVRHTFALLLLGVMVFWTMPRTVFHECSGKSAHHEREAARSVKTDEHCSLCELTAPPMVHDAQYLSCGYFTLVLSEVSEQSTSSCVAALIERTGRGPPALG